MKKIIVLTLVLLLISMTAVGCGGNSSDTSSDSSTTAESNSAKTTDSGSDSSQTEGVGGLSGSYMAYMEIKSDLVTRLADGLGESQPMAAMGLLGMNMVEMFLVPMAALGVDETYAETTLAYLNASGVKYSSDGDNYSVTYTDGTGAETTCETKYDPDREAAVTTITEAGKEALVFEYYKTSYGYASQYLIMNDDGTYTIYKGTFYGKDGTVGMTEAAAEKPASIMDGGEVSKDFPKDSTSWYTVEGTAGTGVGTDGTAYEFKVPAEASN
jgi:hypothetical protein